MAYRTGRQLIEQDLSGITELRIHGVGGASPEQVLDVPYTDWVAGDLTAGFFTAPEAVPIPGPKRRLEAYSWGGLTSRSAVRSLWLLLLPFALINMSGWMMEHECDPGSDERLSLGDRLSIVTLRLYGLAVTIASVFYAAVIGIDLYAYQCGGSLVCADGRLVSWPLSNGVVVGHLGRQLVVGALVPIAVVAVVAWITKRSQDWVHPDLSAEAEESAGLDPAGKVGLADAAFWRSPQVSHRLGIGHTAAGVATTGLVLASTLDQIPDAGIGAGYQAVFIALLGVVAVAVVLLGRLGARWYWGLLGVSFAALVGQLIATWFLTVGGDRMVQAPGARDMAQPLFFIVFVLLIMHGVSQFLVQPKGGKFLARLFNWFAPLSIAFLGYGIVAAFGSGALIQVSNFLGHAVARAAYDAGGAVGVDDAPLVYSDVVGMTAVNTAFIVVLIAGLTALIALWRLLRRESLEEIAAAYGDDKALGDMSASRLLKTISSARAIARMTDAVALILSVAILVLAASIVQAIIAVGGNLDDVSRQVFFAGWQRQASAFLGLLAVAAVILVDRSRRSAGVRRGLGIVWDITTFWPRWFHPYAPPSYGERAVPQLAFRVQQIRGAGGSVVLSGHSQGTAVAVAAVARLSAESDETLDKVMLITHGSPVGRLYGRFFRRYFSVELRRSVAEVMRPTDATGNPVWVNLHRKTDYIGGAVFRKNEAEPGRYRDTELLDPVDLTFRPGEGLPKPLRHFDYFREREYQRVVDGMCASLLPQEE